MVLVNKDSVSLFPRMFLEGFFKCRGNVRHLYQQTETTGTKFLSPHPLMLLVKFGWHWPSSFRENIVRIHANDTEIFHGID